MKYLLAIALLLSFTVANGQVTTQKTFGPGNWKALVTVPSSYAGSTDSLPCILYIPGAGEIGTGYPGLSKYGPHARLAGGWDGGVPLSNGTVYPIIISLEPYTDYATNAGFVKIVLDSILNQYRIKRNSMHTTGFSAGSFAWKIFVTYDVYDSVAPYGPFQFADYINSIVDIQGVQPDDNPDWLRRTKNFARNKHGGRYLGFWGTGDGSRYIPEMAASMNAAVSGSAIADTTHNAHNAAAWNRFFGSSTGSVPDTFFLDGISQDVYQWMIRQGDTSSAVGGTNDAPTANAGSDATITLPTSSYALNGSGSTDGDGTIVSYRWKLMKSAYPATISDTTSATPTISGLIQGKYQLRLTVKDNDGASGFDYVWITVNEKDPTNCNVSSPVTYTLTPTGSEIYIPNAASRPWKGGDTLKIPAGTYSLIEISNFHGDSCRPIIITNSGGQVNVTGQFRIKNTASYFRVTGTGTTGITYGFKLKVLAVAIAKNFEIDHIEATNPSGVGLYIKVDPDSTNPNTLHPNYVMRNIYIHHNYLHDINGEAMYIGYTTPSDSSHGGFPVRLSDVEIAYNIVENATWDGIQLSNSYGYNSIHHNTVTNYGTIFKPSQQAGIILGGNVNGDVYNNTVFKGSGNGIEVFGYDTINVYNNLVDSTGWDTTALGQHSVFISDYVIVSEPGNPVQKINFYNNAINNPPPRGAVTIEEANDNAGPAHFYDNTFCIQGDTTDWQNEYINIDPAGSVHTNSTISCPGEPEPTEPRKLYYRRKKFKNAN